MSSHQPPLNLGGVFCVGEAGVFPLHLTPFEKNVLIKCVGGKMRGEMGENFPPHSSGCEFIFIYPRMLGGHAGGNCWQ